MHWKLERSRAGGGEVGIQDKKGDSGLRAKITAGKQEARLQGCCYVTRVSLPSNSRVPDQAWS